MSGLSVFMGSPADNTTIGRSARVSGSVTGAGSGSLFGATIQFGIGGPTFQLFGHRSNRVPADWIWQGLIPNNIRPGQAFQIIVKSDGEIVTGKDGEGEDVFKPVDGKGILNLVLENVVPAVAIDAFQSTTAVLQLPHTFTLAGSASEANGSPYGVAQVQCQVGNGPFISANPIAPGDWSRWSFPVSVPTAGDTLITARASDPFDTSTTAQRPLTVLQFQMPAAIDPPLPKTRAGVPTTSSITSWTRLEPQCNNADIDTATRARLFDPLWLMTRQWQVGEFQAEDAGSPVQARVRATNAALTRCYFGELSATHATAQAYDPARAPLEAMVERRRMRAATTTDARMLTLAVEAGLHFLRMLELNATAKKYRPAFLAKYAMPDEAAAAADDATLRFVQTMVGRASDARLLAAAFRHPASAAQIVFDASLNIAAADVAAVQQVATAWLAWYDGLFAEPANPADDAWTAPRLEYAVSVATRLSAQPDDSVTFSASEFDGGRLDWSSFDANDKFSIDTTGDHRFAALNEITVPSPVSFRGAPAARFWELEDAKVAYGLMSAGPTDLAHLLMIEYASSYGNDWYVVPLSVPVGTVTRVDSLVVTDTFGVRSLLRPLGDAALPPPYFSMWQPASLRHAGDAGGAPVSNRFFVPPTIGRSIDGAALEDVLFMRDEMANLAWGIERNIEGAVEASVSLAHDSATPSAAAPTDPGAPPHYRLSTTVPENWIPLLPVQLQLENPGPLVTRLKRGALLQPDGSNKSTHARSEALKALGSSLLCDEEIPREGVRITRRRRMTRWTDGSTWVWTAFRNEVGRGEGSAGLRFDRLEGGGEP